MEVHVRPSLTNAFPGGIGNITTECLVCFSTLATARVRGWTETVTIYRLPKCVGLFCKRGVPKYGSFVKINQIICTRQRNVSLKVVATPYILVAASANMGRIRAIRRDTISTLRRKGMVTVATVVTVPLVDM